MPINDINPDGVFEEEVDEEEMLKRKAEERQKRIQQILEKHKDDKTDTNNGAQQGRSWIN